MIGLGAQTTAMLTFIAVVCAMVAIRGARAAARRGVVRDRLADPPQRSGSGRWAQVGPGSGPPPAWFYDLASAAGLGASASVWWRRWLVLAVAAPVAGLVCGGAALAVASAGLALVAPLAVLRARRGQDEVRLQAALPEVLEEVARGVRGGLALPVAVASTAGGGHGPWAPDLRRLALALDSGAGLTDELAAWRDRRPLPGLQLAVAALSLGAETGGAQARALDGVATTLRDREAVRAELLALSSQARASAVVMALTPLAFAFLAAVTDPRTAAFLVHTVAGVGCLVGGALLDLAALAWMLRISGSGS